MSKKKKEPKRRNAHAVAARFRKAGIMRDRRKRRPNDARTKQRELQKEE